MEEYANGIAEILHDYHNYDGFNFTPDHVITWVKQFNQDDQEFILSEFLHLLKQGIYVNENQAKKLLITIVDKLASVYGGGKTLEFLQNVDFLRLQPADKSQDILLNMLDKELFNKYGIELKQCGQKSKKYAVYIDDILATGGTLFRDCLGWLKEENPDGVTNLEKVMNGEKVLLINHFCRHNWANPAYRLKLELKREVHNKISFRSAYTIENHPSFLNQRFNFAYPNENQPAEVKEYLEGLPVQAVSKEEHAFRKATKPQNESFYSSEENRTRFENVILMKGIELLSKTGTLKPNHRPMGAVTPSYKTLGTGTLFFTWRNISNTTPIVFWWGNGNNWYPLFPLYKRGLSNVTVGQ